MSDTNLIKEEQFIQAVSEKAAELGIDEYFVATENGCNACKYDKGFDIKFIDDVYTRRKLCIEDMDNVRFFDLYVIAERPYQWAFAEPRSCVPGQLYILNKDDSARYKYAISVCGNIEFKKLNQSKQQGGIKSVGMINNPSIYLYRIDPTTLVPKPILLLMSVNTHPYPSMGMFRIFAMNDQIPDMNRYVDVNMSDTINYSSRPFDEHRWYERVMDDAYEGKILANILTEVVDNSF